jgi:GNAT superfamily N-acetyltransferase
VSPEPRRASAADLDAIAGALAAAFLDDPVMHWLVPGERRRSRVVRAFMGLRAKQLLAQDEVWTTGGHEGAALWALPGQWRESPREVWEMFRALFPDILRNLPRSLRGLDRVEKAHPDEPHMYLAVLGTHPDHQGQGVGSRLLAPVLEDCDANQVPAYLESSKRQNIAFYTRFGFRQTGEIQLPGGPPVWQMWRDPR